MLGGGGGGSVTIEQYCLFVWATVVGIGISCVKVHSRWIEVGTCVMARRP